MAGGTGSPYREPCGGWPAGGRRYFGGCGGNHYLTSETAIPKFTNFTALPNYDSGSAAAYPTIPPYTRPDADNGLVACGGADQPECGPWPLADRPAGCTIGPGEVVTEALNNCYKLNGTVNLAVCDKRYYKNVQARKFWHGRLGFDEDDHHQTYIGPQEDNGSGQMLPLVDANDQPDCICQGYGQRSNNSDPENIPPARYLAESRSIYGSGSYTYADGVGGTIAASYTATREAGARIDRNSGVRTQTGWVENHSVSRVVNGVDAGITTLAECGDVPLCGYNCTAPGPVSVTGNWIDILFTVDCEGGILTFGSNPDPCTTRFNGSGNEILPTPCYPTFIPNAKSVNEWAARMTQTVVETSATGSRTYAQTCSIEEFSNTVLHLKITCAVTIAAFNSATESGSAESEINLIVGLSEAYPKEDLFAEVVELLEQIPLNDDVLYPWRDAGGDCLFAPLVCRREYLNAAPSPLGLGAGYSDFQADYYDGAVLGALLPGGYQNHFDFDRLMYSTTTTIVGYGGFQGDDGIGADLPANATHWTNKNEATGIYPGAFLRYDPTTGALWAQKWVETKINFPSINFFRPCGFDRTVEVSGSPAWSAPRPICGRIAITSATQNGAAVDMVLSAAADYLQTGDTVDFSGVSGLGTGVTVGVTDPTHISVTGTLSGPYTSGGYVKTSGAPSYEWHDDQPKGDFQIRTWEFNYRDVGEFSRLTTVAASCTDEDHDCESIDVPDEPRPNQATHGMPQEVSSFSVTEDCLLAGRCAPSVIAITPNGESWGARGKVYGFPSGFNCDATYGSRWQRVAVQAFPDPFFRPPDALPDAIAKWVEARSTVPSGAPGLPTGVAINCLTLAQLDNDPLVDDGIVCAPPGAEDACTGQGFNHAPGQADEI